MMTKPLTWQQIIDRVERVGRLGDLRAPWGGFKVGLSDPQESTAGMLALMALSDTDDDGEVEESEQATLLGLKKVVSLTTTSTEAIFDGLRDAAGKDAKKALTYVSAFPALEQDVLEYNLARPKVPLVALYPQDGTAEADFPYLLLKDADWVTEQSADVASAFLEYARGPQGRAAFLAAGFRDPNRAPGPTLTAANGVTTKITALPRAILLPESVSRATATWTAITRPTNVLFIFDTSGSMDAQVRGTGKTRLDLTKAAAINALNLLDDTARVGVWAFSTTNTGQDHRKLLPLTRLDAESSGTHREAVTRTINGLTAGGNTGLYNTVWAACQEVSKQYQPNAANFVVLLTDGADDNNIAGSLSLEQLKKNLRTTCGGNKPVQVITVGLGVESQSKILRDISAATKAPTYASNKVFDINQVVLSFLFD
jgi:Ca-activated chloride channel family protein